MPDGEMRRPPQLWEQRLARLTSVLGVGLSSSDTTAIVPPQPPPGTGGGTEPAPVLPPPGRFIKPSTPTLVGSVQGVNVLWDGLNSAGELWPYDTSWVEVHMATSGTGFTPGTATLKGRLARPGAFFVGGLTAGTPYYFRLRGADPAGNYTEASDAATGFTGLTTSSDYGTATIGTGAVSFNARSIGGVTNTVGSTAPTSPLLNDVWLDSSPGTAIIHKIWNGSTWVTNAWGSASIAAGQITALQIAAGAVTAGAIAADAITGKTITGGTITGTQITGVTITGGLVSGGTVSGGLISGGTINGATITSTSVAGYQVAGTYLTPTDVGSGGSTVIDGGRITSGTITGRTVQSSTGSGRVEMTNGNRIVFYRSSNAFSDIYTDTDGLTFRSSGDIVFGPSSNWSATTPLTTISDTGAFSVGYTGGNKAFRVAADAKVYSYGVDTNETANAANVRVGASAQLLKSTSTSRRKTDLRPLSEGLAGVAPEKVSSEPANVNPYDVLTLVPTEFQSLAAADEDARVFGFIAEDVAEKFPWACDWDNDGLPDSVQDRPIVAALLQVVKDLTARIDVLEGN